MIFGDVENGRRRRFQAPGGFELEAGELQHVKLRGRFQQRQCRQADIAADADLPARGARHLADQRGDGTLAVGAGDRHDRRLRLAAEQLDIADDFHARLGRFS